MTQIPLYRLQGGVDHFYTSEKNESDLFGSLLGYNFEGVACCVENPTDPQPDGTYPLRRYHLDVDASRSPSRRVHIYVSKEEGDIDISKFGFKDDGKIVGYIYSKPKTDTTPLYRYYNQKLGGHFYTTDFNELGSGNDEWKFVLIQGYVFESSKCSGA